MWKALRAPASRSRAARVERLMRANGICGAKRRGKPWRTTSPDPAARRRPDLVDRDFTAAGPNRLWVADLTYLRCWEGVVFFAFVIDAYSRRIVGWQLAGHMRTTLVLDALRMALHQRGGRRRRRARPSLRSRQPIHLDRLHPDPRRPRRPGLGRLGRRRLRQRAGRELRRLLQDRADRRPRLAHPHPARARRSSNTSAGSTPPACTKPSATCRPPSSKPSPPRGDEIDHIHKNEGGNHLTRSPRKPGPTSYGM